MAFETEMRDLLIETMGDLFDVETVDIVDFDTDRDQLVIEVTSTWASSDNQEDAAWLIVKALSVLWNDDNFFGATFRDIYSPGLRFVNSGTVYDCSPEIMIDIANTRAGRSDMEASCR